MYGAPLDMCPKAVHNSDTIKQCNSVSRAVLIIDAEIVLCMEHL